MPLLVSAHCCDRLPFPNTLTGVQEPGKEEDAA